MRDLPRARALVRLDGPGHIMPVEPVTPPDSRVWRVIHLPVMLALVAIGLLFAMALAINVLGLGTRLAGHVPAARYLLPLIGAGATILAYLLFVRIVERRTDMEELSARDALPGLGRGYAGGLLLSLATFGMLAVLGSVEIEGFNPPAALLVPFVGQLCTAVILEIIVCGLGFRLVERFLGSWSTLVLTGALFGALRLIAADATPFAALAVALEASLLFAVVFMASRQLWAAIGLHAGWRFAQIGLYGTATTDPQGFVQTRVAGPDWLTGGQSGTDASAPALCVTSVAIVVLLAVAIRRGQIVRPVWRRGRWTQTLAARQLARTDQG